MLRHGGIAWMATVATATATEASEAASATVSATGEGQAVVTVVEGDHLYRCIIASFFLMLNMNIYI